jgi:hypothetical protein
MLECVRRYIKPILEWEAVILKFILDQTGDVETVFEQKIPLRHPVSGAEKLI